MRYLANITPMARDVEKVKNLLIMSNPVLEAFGNAKTVRNDNSSRFVSFFPSIMCGTCRVYTINKATNARKNVSGHFEYPPNCKIHDISMHPPPWSHEFHIARLICIEVHTYFFIAMDRASTWTSALTWPCTPKEVTSGPIFWRRQESLCNSLARETSTYSTR